MASARRVAAHDQRENFRIGREGRAIGMIGGEEYLPRIVDQHEQFKAAGPLHGIDEIVLPIEVGNDAAAIAVAVVDHGFFWLAPFRRR